MKNTVTVWLYVYKADGLWYPEAWRTRRNAALGVKSVRSNGYPVSGPVRVSVPLVRERKGRKRP